MSKPKAVRAVISLTIQAGQAKPSPPVGPALGQAGLNIMAFCKDFNAKTADLKVSAASADREPSCQRLSHLQMKHVQDDVPVPVKITAYTDKSFVYVSCLVICSCPALYAALHAGISMSLSCRG